MKENYYSHNNSVRMYSHDENAMNEPPRIHSLSIDSTYRPPPITTITIKSSKSPNNKDHTTRSTTTPTLSLSTNINMTDEPMIQKSPQKKSPTHQKKLEKFIATRKQNLKRSPTRNHKNNDGDDDDGDDDDTVETDSSSHHHHHHHTPNKTSSSLSSQQHDHLSPSERINTTTSSPPPMTTMKQNIHLDVNVSGKSHSFEELVSFDAHYQTTPKNGIVSQQHEQHQQRQPSTTSLHSFGANSPCSISPRNIKTTTTTTISPQENQQVYNNNLPDEYSFHVEDVEDSYLDSLLVPLPQQHNSIIIPSLRREAHVLEKEVFSTTLLNTTLKDLELNNTSKNSKTVSSSSSTTVTTTSQQQQQQQQRISHNKNNSYPNHKNYHNNNNGGGICGTTSPTVVPTDDDSLSQATLIQYYGGKTQSSSIVSTQYSHNNNNTIPRLYHRPMDEILGGGSSSSSVVATTTNDSTMNRDMKFHSTDHNNNNDDDESVLLSFADNVSMIMAQQRNYNHNHNNNNNMMMTDPHHYPNHHHHHTPTSHTNNSMITTTDIKEGVTELTNMTMRDPSMPMAMGISAAALIGAFFLGPVGVVVGTAAVGISVGIMQIPEAQRTHAMKKLNELLDSTYQSVCSTDTSPCIDGKGMSFPVHTSSVVGGGGNNSNGGNIIMNNTHPFSSSLLHDSPQSMNSQFVLEPSILMESTTLINGKNSPSHQALTSINSKISERQVMAMRKNKTLPLNQIHSLDPSKQPRAWLDVVASASSSVDEKCEAMEEILIWSKDKIQARRLLEEGILDSLLFLIKTFSEKNASTSSVNASPSTSSRQNPYFCQALLASNCCIALAKAHAAAILGNGDLYSGNVPLARQCAVMLMETPHFIAVKKDDATEPGCMFKLSNMASKEAEDIGQMIVSLSQGDLGP